MSLNANKIDDIGQYRATILDSQVGLTKNGFPQWVAVLKATEKFVSDKGQMEHFKLAEPGWVDWTSFNEEIVAYQVLFSNTEEYSEQTATLAYGQLKALGWDGANFESIPALKGTLLSFRVEENEYQGKKRIQVAWIDLPDATGRTLKALDANEIKAMNAKLRMKKPPVAPAKAPAKAPPVAVQAPAEIPAEPSQEKKSDPMLRGGGDNPTTPTKRRGRPAKPAAPAGPTADKTTPDEAWDAVAASAKGNSEIASNVWGEAFRDIVKGDYDEKNVTPEQWAEIRNSALTKLKGEADKLGI